MYVCIYVCMYVWVRACTYIRTYVCVYMYSNLLSYKTVMIRTIDPFTVKIASWVIRTSTDYGSNPS